ncbi:MAG: ABC transporter permease [Micrococcales bacterium 72-143]|nr:MAG: ABC transporter permease [Micrococcales bacterium 72-143]
MAAGLLRGILVVAFLFGALFPLAWLVISGFKARNEVTRTPFQFFPEVWKWENYAQILSDPAFLRTVLVTLAGALIFAALSVAINSMAAYVFARLDFAFKRLVWVVVIGTMFLPGMAILLTSFIVVTRLHMLDTLAVLILPGAASAAQIFFLRQFYLSVPRALEESAFIDGAGRFRIFVSIFVPMSKPVFVVVAMTSFLAFWNSYVWPVMTISSPDLFQIQQYLASFRFERGNSELGLLMAGSALAAAPVIILCLVLQRYIVEGIKISGIK